MGYLVGEPLPAAYEGFTSDPNLKIGPNFRVFARGQGATLRGSGALEMIVDGTEKPLGQKEPSSTSPSLL